MNVYMYEGKDRYSASKNLVKYSEQAKVGKRYFVDMDSGIFMVAYPNKDSETDFGFKYWLGEVSSEDIA